MKKLTKAAVLLIAFGVTGTASATSFTFLDSPASSTLVTEGSSFNSSINYTGLDGPITSAILTILLSDDPSSTLGGGYVDIPIEIAQLTFVTGNVSDVSPALNVEVDGNSGTLFGVDVDFTGGPVGTPTPPPGTVGSYFNFDVTSLIGGASGSLTYFMDALNTRDNFPALAGGGSYTEDFNYEGAELSIETSAVPVPAAIWLMGSGLMGLFGFSRKKS